MVHRIGKGDPSSVAPQHDMTQRGFCPSCLGRRMTVTAARLVEEVLPAVPVRQWVVRELSLRNPLSPGLGR